MLCCMTGSWAAQWRGPSRSLASRVRSADELDGDSEVEAGPVAVGRDYGEVESFGEREAGAVGERESVRFRQGVGCTNTILLQTARFSRAPEFLHPTGTSSPPRQGRRRIRAVVT